MATFLVDGPSRELVANFLIWERLRPLVPDARLFIDEQDHFFGRHGSNLGPRFAADADFVFTPSFNVARTPSVYLRAMAKGIPLIVYHSEQFFQSYYDREKLNLDQAARFAELVDLHLVWGDFFKQRLIEVGVPENRIKVVGSIKSEVVIRKNRLARPSEDHLERSSARYDFIFLSSFSIADLTDDDWSVFRRQFALGEDIDERINARACRAGMFDFIRRLATAAPSKSILVRRHPGEPVGPYSSALGDLTNVTLSSMGPIGDDILAADLALLQDSTSVFELEAAGRRWISVNFADSEDLYRCEPRQAFPRHDADLVLEGLLKNDTKGLLGSRSLDALGTEYFMGPSDIDVSRRIADAILSLRGKPHPKRLTVADLIEGGELVAKAALSTMATTPVLGRLPPLPSIRRRLEFNSTQWAQGEHEFDDVDLRNARETALVLLSADAP